MTVATTTRTITYAGNGVLTIFAYPFKLIAEGHALVTLIVDSTGIGTTQVNPTHYSVSDVGIDTGGNITMVTAPASGESLVIERVPPLTQLTDLRNQGSFVPQTLEDALDLIVMMMQAVSAGAVDDHEPTWPVFTEATKPAATATRRGKPYTVRDAGGNEHGEIVYQRRDNSYGVFPLFTPFG